MTTPPRLPSSGDGPSAAQVMRGLVPSVYAPTLLEFTGLSALMPVVPLLALQLGFDVTQAAALTVIFGISSLVGPIPAGRVISAVGARAALVTTGAGLVVANLLAFAVISSGLDGEPSAMHRGMLIGLLIVMAVNSQVWALGRQAYLGTALPAGMRARGMTLFGGTIRIGQVIGPLLGALVMAIGEDSWVFLLFAVVAAAATVMVAVNLPAGEARGGRRYQERGRRAPRSPVRRRLDGMVLARMVRVVLGIAPVMMARVNRPVIVPLLGASLGLDSVWISVVFGVSAVIEILMVLPAGTLMDRYGRAAVAVPCAGLMGIGYVLLAVLAGLLGERGTVSSVLVLLLPSLLIALGNGLGSGIVMTLGIDVSPVHGRTGYLAWWNTLLGGGRLLAPLMVTGITVIAPVAVAGTATGALCLAGALWLARTLPRLTPSGGTRSR